MPISQRPITDNEVQQWEVFNRHGDTPINDVNVGLTLMNLFATAF
jgi:hypothetical protein